MGDQESENKQQEVDKSLVKEQKKKAMRRHISAKRLENLLPSINSLIYAARLIVENRLESETTEGIEIALKLMETELDLRYKYEEETMERVEKFEDVLNLVSTRIGEMPFLTDDLVLSEDRKIYAIYLYLLEPERFISDVKASQHLKVKKSTLSGHDDDNFDDFQIEPVRQ